jgi:hypothetical protein
MKIKFARFGGLSSVNQRGYKSNTYSFHGPPCRRGFYAFVWPHYDFFLLSGGKTTSYPWAIGTKFSYVKDSKGNIIDDVHPEFEELTEGHKYWSIPTKSWDSHMKAWYDMNLSYEDPSYNKTRDEFDAKWEEANKGKGKYVLVKKPSPKIFEYTGNLWHHLAEYLGPSGVIKQKGGWTLSSFDEYKKALEKDMHQAIKLQTHEYNQRKIPYSTKNPYCGVCKDHLEVFIEKL